MLNGRTPHPPASRGGNRHYSPKEFAATLSDLGGIVVHERTIQRRCGLPESDPQRISTNPEFVHYWIPESELVRLLHAGKAVA